MKLEQQVTNLELSKRMKELGFKQESLFKWHSKIDEKGDRCHTELVYLPTPTMEQDYSAYTVAELGEMLQSRYEPLSSSMKGSTVPVYIGGEYGWYVNGELTIRGDTEADARAKCLIWLAEHDMIKT